jgi:hypothetical protein
MSFTNGIIVFAVLLGAVGMGMAWTIRSTRDPKERLKKMLPFLFLDVLFIAGFILFVLQNQV